MYEQFMELAGVDITKEPMEVGPTCHYIMGGIAVDAETGATPRSRPLRAPASARAGCTARRGSAATRSPTCSCSAGAPATAAAEYARDGAGRRRVDDARGRRGGRARCARYLDGAGEDPYALHAELQATMQANVGIFRDEAA